MGRLALPISVAAAAALAFAAPVAAADVIDVGGVPSRTAFSFRSVLPGIQWGTANAAEYRLTGTKSGPDWGSSYTSTADVATFLATKKRTAPGSPIFMWMAAASERAADGTSQDWGTARLPGVEGTKWGWSDSGPM
ncbi:hypothetical protein AB0L63_24870 [Nocardia sp. NPDC051990]|uniref:hypothetical protein n=1 Tax=Nocardia sp. NPDC051990 TaxID=3155285 RepID=UPI00344330B0